MSGSAVTLPELHIQTACGPGMDAAATSLCCDSVFRQPRLVQARLPSQEIAMPYKDKRDNYFMSRAFAHSMNAIAAAEGLSERLASPTSAGRPGGSGYWAEGAGLPG